MVYKKPKIGLFSTGDEIAKLYNKKISDMMLINTY